MTHSEALDPVISEKDFSKIKELLKASDNDAQLIFWGPEDDIDTALETIEERCRMAFDGVPQETRKSFEDGTSIFERVLPGADRMYPDTDSAPIPLEEEEIEAIRNILPEEVIDRYHKMKEWGIPEDTYTYIFKKNLFPLIEKIITELEIPAVYAGTFFGHKLKFIEGHYAKGDKYKHGVIYELFAYLREPGLDLS